MHFFADVMDVTEVAQRRIDFASAVIVTEMRLRSVAELVIINIEDEDFVACFEESSDYAAADTASEAFRPKAISWVLIGGIFAAVIGSQLVIATKDLWPPYLFAATYLARFDVSLASNAAEFD